MKQTFEKIVTLLNNKGVSFEVLDHQPIFTSEDGARVRGFSKHQGAKSLVLKTPDEFILAVIPGDRRLDNLKLRQLLGVRKLRFATPEEVIEVMGCKIGSCYPIGSIPSIRTFVDNSLGENEVIGFSPAMHDKSIIMKFNDLMKLMDASLADITP